MERAVSPAKGGDHAFAHDATKGRLWKAEGAPWWPPRAPQSLAPPHGAWSEWACVVGKDADRQNALRSIREWAESLKPGVLELEESRTKFEWVLSMTPTAKGAARLEFRFGGYGTVDIIAGQGLNAEDQPIDNHKLLEVCEAMRSGCLTERTWTMRDRVVRVDSVLELPTGQLSHRDMRNLPGTLRFAKQEVVKYAPWT